MSGVLRGYRDDLAAARSSMTPKRTVVAVLTLVVLAMSIAGWQVYEKVTTVAVTAHFANTNGLYPGDAVKVMGVTIGEISSIEPDDQSMRVRLVIDSRHQVPAGAQAVIMSPTLVSARFVQLAPGYTGGPTLADGSTIPIERTAVPVEWDDFRDQLEDLSSSLGSTKDGERGPMSKFISSAAEAIDGKGRDINQTLEQLSRAATTLGDGRSDLFATIRNLQVFSSALKGSGEQMAQFNRDLAEVTSVLTDTDDELAQAIDGVDGVLEQLTTFVADNRDGIATAVSTLARVTSSLRESEPDIEQLLHVGPNAFANFYNIYQPAQGTLTGALSVTQFQNPIQFICGAIQAASQEGAQESARRCAQYLGPVLKNIAFNYPPVGTNPIRSVQMRPEQIDYSETGLRPPAGMTNTSVPGVFSPKSDSGRTMIRQGSGLSGLMSVPDGRGRR